MKQRTLIGIALIVGLALLLAGIANAQGGIPDRSLVLWNRLGSQSEVENSLVGPDGTIVNVRGNISFVPGKFGNGFTATGSSMPAAGVDFGLWENIHPNYDQAGAIEFWWKPARNYDETGAPDETFHSGIWVPPPQPISPMALMYRWRGVIGGFDFTVIGSDRAAHVYASGRVVPFQAGEWLHVAFVWDMNGLPGHPGVRYGVYVNGDYVPLVDALNPGGSIDATMGHFDNVRFSMGYYDADWNNQLNGVLDNVKMWNYAKTDYSDRFWEDGVLPIDVDVKPGSCPNPLNTKSRGVLPVAILGTPDFDVTTLDPATIRLTREGYADGVAPLRWAYEDVATPDRSGSSGCHDLSGDGYADLALKFNLAELVVALNLRAEMGNVVPLLITGNLTAGAGGRPVEGMDYVSVK